MWTLDELLERVSAALAAEYSGPPNGRVRDVPDRRAVRWYATTGLVDRPSAMRGRTALYDKRHLLQLVALKRLQSQGRTLAEVQVELAGATDTKLAGIARVPETLLESGDSPPQEAVRPRFWAEAAAVPAQGPGPSAMASESAPAPAPPAPASAPSPSAGPASESESAALPLPPTQAPAPPPPAPPPPPSAQASPPPVPAPPPPPIKPWPLNGVALPGGAVVLVPGTPTAADCADIAAAAQPLLDLLGARGLLTNEREPS